MLWKYEFKQLHTLYKQVATQRYAAKAFSRIYQTSKDAVQRDALIVFQGSVKQCKQW